MAKITDFLNHLASDPAYEAKFDADPARVMTKAGLDARQQRLILKGSLSQIRKEIKKEMPDLTVFLIKMTLAP